MWQKMIQPQLLECMHIQSSNSFSFVNFLKKPALQKGRTFFEGALLFSCICVFKNYFFAFSQRRRYTILFCCIVAWILSDNYGCQEDFVLSENEISWKYFKVFARAILKISKTIYNRHSKYLKMFETILSYSNWKSS